MHYKLKEWQVNGLISFISHRALQQEDITLTDTYESIQALVFGIVKEGSDFLVPIESVKKILDVSNINSPTEDLMNKRYNSITNIWDCDIVEHRPMLCWWRIPYHNRDNEFVYLTSNQYYEVKAYYDAGKKIQGIKVIREATGMGLKPAKEMYEETFILAKKVDKKGD